VAILAQTNCTSLCCLPTLVAFHKPMFFNFHIILISGFPYLLHIHRWQHVACNTALMIEVRVRILGFPSHPDLWPQLQGGSWTAVGIGAAVAGAARVLVTIGLLLSDYGEAGRLSASW